MHLYRSLSGIKGGSSEVVKSKETLVFSDLQMDWINITEEFNNKVIKLKNCYDVYFILETSVKDGFSFEVITDDISFCTLVEAAGEYDVFPLSENNVVPVGSYLKMEKVGNEFLSLPPVYIGNRVFRKIIKYPYNSERHTRLLGTSQLNQGEPWSLIQVRKGGKLLGEKLVNGASSLEKYKELEEGEEVEIWTDAPSFHDFSSSLEFVDVEFFSDEINFEPTRDNYGLRLARINSFEFLKKISDRVTFYNLKYQPNLTELFENLVCRWLVFYNDYHKDFVIRDNFRLKIVYLYDDNNLLENYVLRGLGNLTSMELSLGKEINLSIKDCPNLNKLFLKRNAFLNEENPLNLDFIYRSFVDSGLSGVEINFETLFYYYRTEASDEDRQTLIDRGFNLRYDSESRFTYPPVEV